MSVTEHERHQIPSWFEENMGPDLAPAMMNLVPPVGWGDLATKRDLDNLRTELRGEITALRGTITALRGEITGLDGEITGLDGTITGLRGEMHGAFGDVRAEMHQEISKLRRDMYTVFVAGLGLMTAIVGSIVALT